MTTEVESILTTTIEKLHNGLKSKATILMTTCEVEEGSESFFLTRGDNKEITIMLALFLHSNKDGFTKIISMLAAMQEIEAQNKR